MYILCTTASEERVTELHGIAIINTTYTTDIIMYICTSKKINVHCNTTYCDINVRYLHKQMYTCVKSDSSAYVLTHCHDELMTKLKTLSSEDSSLKPRIQ